jgi:NADH-quinone oxidoreductase subunit M
MKRLIAFSSVAHMGFVMLGISTLTSLGINAALFGMVAHGLITGMLFFVAGSVKERYHTLEIKRLRGMLLQVPKLAWILGFCAMASLGLPGLAGFWGEFPAILASWSPLHGAGLPFGGLSLSLFRVLTVVAALGTVLAAGYLLWLYQRTAFGEVNPEFAGAHDSHGHDAHETAHDAGAHDDHSSDIHDVTKFEWLAWTPLLVAILVFGVLPQLMFKLFDPGVTELVKVFGGK